MVNSENKIFCLMGPTAVGKSELALKLAQLFPIEIISVDSAMIYRGLDIGTAKPNAAQLQAVPHHLIDICDPRESYSAGQFRHDAIKKIQDILARDKIPLLVGGSMLYFWVLAHGIAELPKSDEQIRTKIYLEKKRLGLDALYSRLTKIDPVAAANIEATDSQRIQRALEVYEMTGKSLTELHSLATPNALPYDTVDIMVEPQNISLLRTKIEKRFKKMLQLGWIKEVQKLYQRSDLHQNLPAMRLVGYRQILRYLASDITYKKMLELVPIATGQLAKRQLTWLKKWPHAHRVREQNLGAVFDIISRHSEDVKNPLP